MKEDDPYKGLNATSRTYVGLHDAMMKMYFDKKHTECLELAAKLLTKADLPILIRARCHTVMALKENSAASVLHGERAVDILDVEARTVASAEEFPENQLEEARRILGVAKERAAASVHGGPSQGQDQDQAE